MKELEYLSKQAKYSLIAPAPKQAISVKPETILAIAEAFRSLEQRAEAAEAKLAELEKQASEQKPFLYGIMTANGDAHFEDFCISSDPGLLEDVIWEWNNTLADNEPKNRVVALFTRPAPAVSLVELVPQQSLNGQANFLGDKEPYYNRGWNDCRAAMLRSIEGPK